MSGNVFFREGATYYRLPPTTTNSISRVPTWRDYVSLNETLWRDFGDLHKKKKFSLGWDALESAELDLLLGAWNRIMSGAPVEFGDMDGTIWTVEFDPESIKLTYEMYGGALQKPATIGLGESGTMTQWGMLYQCRFTFRGKSAESYSLP